ncbi:hypothetical protein [Micromonospora sediminimaris]|uniref:Protein kinase domain-containing protein n=1 Tax=Micromonospora sediminimaris TaxID=547162 RepID=A0A9W5UPE9_9ACTN|nr:hypothetical protein [Micromonospora sediminimaris]GIJ33239.1 hypothetical protein Vse01_23870 [Micromonospora sediminimaris]SFC07576.1 hypothetical protein SAMN05216284_102419 [Micromonospora sediminimaris]
MGNRLSPGRQLPDAVRSAIREYTRATDVRLVEEFAPDPHRTDALLCCVTAIWNKGGREMRQNLIVKVVSANSAEDITAGHEAAQNSPPSFAERHIVRLLGWYRVDDDRRLLIQQFANGGDEVTTYAALSYKERLIALPLIVDGLVNHWNAPESGLHGPRVCTRTTSVGEFVRGEVERMATVTSVLAVAADLGVPEDAGAWLVLGGDRRPNPLTLLTAPDSPLSRLEMDCLVGHSHGDLNGGNVLIPSERGERQYGRFLLVDPGGYQADGPLTRDIAFGLLGTLLRTVAPRTPVGEPGDELPRDQADALRRYLINPDAHYPEKLLRGLAQLIDKIDQTGREHARQAGFGKDWRRQWRLTLVAHALLHLTFDDIGDTGRRWCLRLAAEALEAYLDLLPVDDAATLAAELSRSAPSALLAARHDADGSESRLDLGWPARWSTDQLRDVPLVATPEPAREPALQVPGEARTGRDDAAARWRANHTGTAADAAATRLQAPRPRLPRQDDIASTRRSRLRPPLFRLRTLMALAGVGLAGTVGYVVLPERRGERVAAPTLTVAPDNERETPSAPDRDHDRGPALPTDLAEFAEHVAKVVEEPPSGRYACTRYEVQSWDTDESRSSPSRHRYELWFTADLGGRKVATEFGPAGSRRATTTPFAPGRMDEVSPVPKDDPEALRAQLLRGWGRQPPELRTTSGMLRLIARIMLHHPLVPAQRAVLLEELAEMSGVEFAGSLRNDDGEPGVAFQAEDQDGRWDTLLFDGSGRLLRHDLTQGDLQLSRHTLLTSTRTDTMDTACR